MSKSPNTNAQVLDATLTTSELEIAHNLGRVARDGVVIRQSAAGSVFRGPTAWDETNIYLVGEDAMFVRFYVF